MPEADLAAVPYSRGIMVQMLVRHQRVDGAGCMCGFSTWGASFAEHVVDQYEDAARRRLLGKR